MKAARQMATGHHMLRLLDDCWRRRRNREKERETEIETGKRKPVVKSKERKKCKEGRECKGKGGRGEKEKEKVKRHLPVTMSLPASSLVRNSSVKVCLTWHL